MEFVGNYASCGLSPQTDGMPVIQEKAPHTQGFCQGSDPRGDRFSIRKT